VIPYGRQDISQEDLKAVCDVLQSDFLTQGPMVPEFEKTLTQFTGALHAVAVNSATSGLHIACLALGVGKGDLVWTSPITFVASSNCALYSGADVDFVDIDENTYNMSPEKLEEKLIQAKASNKLPKVVIPVHLAGQSCDMERIWSLSKKYGFKIIEDASHAIGGKYQGVPVGNCKYSDMTILSFHPVKIVTSAEGGAVLCNDPSLRDKLHLLRSHGITRDESKMANKSHGPWYYEQIDLGYNYRMTDVLAALGASQMKRLESFVSKRHEIAKKYFQELKNLPLILPYQSPDTYSAYHLFIVRLKKEVTKTHLQVFTELRENGIGVNLHYIPVYFQPYYERLGFKKGYCPVAEDYYSSAISIPMYATLNQEQQKKVCDVLKKVLG
jgi:UDP-4-amino-4,6-dideoxy-N-acetyl-beta-L-altrosamine transaminase